MKSWSKTTIFKILRRRSFYKNFPKIYFYSLAKDTPYCAKDFSKCRNTVFHFLKNSHLWKSKNANIFENFGFFLFFWLFWIWTPSRAEFGIFHFKRQSGSKYIGNFGYFLIFRNLKFGRESRFWAISLIQSNISIWERLADFKAIFWALLDYFGTFGLRS